MAIRRMISKQEAETLNFVNVEIVTNYPGHEIDRICHDYDCPNRERGNTRHEGCSDRCREYGPLYMLTSHAGVVLSTGEVNGYDDSDFFATVWNEVDGKPERITYASTRGWSYPNSASVDATPDVVAAFEAYIERIRTAQAARDAERKALTPAIGTRVAVVRGRKVAIGTIGEVFWFGADSYYRGSRYTAGLPLDTLDSVRAGAYRIGIRTAEGTKYFLNASNVEVLK